VTYEMMIDIAKDLGILAGVVVPPTLVVYKYLVKKRVQAARDFFTNVSSAVDLVPSLSKDVQHMKDALGPNGGKSIGALIVRTDGRLSLLIDSLSTLTWEARSDGQNVRVNRAFEDWCGWSTADMRGHGWKVLLHPDDAAAYVAAWESAVEDHRPFRYGPVRFVKKDGRSELVTVAANPTDPERGEVSFWLGTMERVKAIAVSDRGAAYDASVG